MILLATGAHVTDPNRFRGAVGIVSISVGDFLSLWELH